VRKLAPYPCRYVTASPGAYKLSAPSGNATQSFWFRTGASVTNKQHFLKPKSHTSKHSRDPQVLKPTNESAIANSRLSERVHFGLARQRRILTRYRGIFWPGATNQKTKNQPMVNPPSFSDTNFAAASMAMAPPLQLSNQEANHKTQAHSECPVKLIRLMRLETDPCPAQLAVSQSNVCKAR
jgi:hypothetical protein